MTRTFDPAVPIRLFIASLRSRSRRRAAAALLALCCGGVAVAAPGGNGHRPKDNGGDGGLPMTIDEERYDFRNLSGDNSCLGEDDHFSWRASGSLAPGESFTFTPALDACRGHVAAISVIASWSGAPLTLSSTVPDDDYTSWDPQQRGKTIVAPAVNGLAQLCMFPSYLQSGLRYTVTLHNGGDATVDDVVLQGRSENDWPRYYYPRCSNADADGDGWNDALEHTMAKLVAPNVGAYRLWGSNYLRAHAATATADDEIDSYPPDFDDNGVVDLDDLARLDGYLGQGNGIPLSRISPNPGDAEWFYANDEPWRRYDLDGDGWVDQTDGAIVADLFGEPLPPPLDSIAPSARLIAPLAGATLTRGAAYRLYGHVWDNAAIARVEYRVDDKTVCAVSDPAPAFGFDSPFNFCWWQVPKKRGVYRLSVRVTDAAGLTTSSRPVTVSAQ